MTQFAKVVWRVADIQSLRPEWTQFQCSEWLVKHESAIQESMVNRGWDAIEDLLSLEDNSNTDGLGEDNGD